MSIDLRQLAVARTASEPAQKANLSRFALPGLLLSGFAVLVTYALRDSLSPPRPVTVVPVLETRGGGGQEEGTALFRAAGWAEPRPSPLLVTALSEGVVEAMLAVEGQALAKGQVVAQLQRADASLALASSEAEVQQREGELAGAKAARDAARARCADPLHLRADLAEAGAVLARAETELAALPLKLRGAKARQEAASAAEERLIRSGASPEASIARARTEKEAARADAEEIAARLKRLPVEAAALKARHDALAQRLERRTEEKRAEGEAVAAVAVAEARLKQAEASRDGAKLRLERLEVRAPMAGRVLALVARPGTRLSGLAPGSLQDSSTVLTMYDPSRLQVRVDVRLDDVAKVRPGMKARIETAAAAQPMEGEVLQATAQADIQKNTLSVKVAVLSPAEGLRPEMLCQVTFLAAAGPKQGDAPSRLYVPRALVEDGRVWVADRAAGVARARIAKTGKVANELVEILSGLSAGERLIVSGREGLRDGTAIRVTAEDESFGVK